MEVSEQPETCEPQAVDKDFLEITSPWTIRNKKQWRDAFTTATPPQTIENTEIDDVVELSTCILLKPLWEADTPCVLDVKVTNGQRIAGITVVSEAYVLEFFKQYGEYNNTAFARYIDKFEGSSVYMGKTIISPPATEVAIKFARIDNLAPEFWVYGIKLHLTEPMEKDADSFDLVQMQRIFAKMFQMKTLRNVTNNLVEEERIVAAKNEENRENRENREMNENGVCKSDRPASNEITKYIDNKFLDMETRLLKRLDEMEERMSARLDAIKRRIEEESIAATTNEEDRGTNQIGDCKNDIQTTVLTDITKYVDNKFLDMETRLFESIAKVEERTNERLDAIKQQIG